MAAADTMAWTSTLSVAEMTAIHQAGFAPVGMVLGSSVYRVGYDWSPRDWYQYRAGPSYGGMGFGGPGGFGMQRGFGGPVGSSGWGGGMGDYPGWYRFYNAGGWAGAPTGFGVQAGFGMCWERTVLEAGVEDAARLALGRLLEEARAHRAHGVIGTRLTFRWMEGMPQTVEFTAMGTAVARHGAAPLASPFTSHLDGQALLKLFAAGLVPVSVGVGVGAVTAEVPAVSLSGGLEVAPYGDAIETSRRLAAEHLHRAAGGQGWAVLGTLAVTSSEGEQGGRTSTTVLTGTAVARVPASERQAQPALPLPVMRLSRP